MTLSGNIFDYVISFWAGVLVSFSPCVYPLMPITATVIAGANTTGTKFKGFIISVIYVFGMAIVYSLLAIIAALTGKAFGQFQNHWAVFLVVGLVFILFALTSYNIINYTNK